jgi:hypothetical protein
VWDGKQMALEDIQGKWDDSFEDAFRFKAEVERTNPGSFVKIDWAKESKKMRLQGCLWFSRVMLMGS